MLNSIQHPILLFQILTTIVYIIHPTIYKLLTENCLLNTEHRQVLSSPKDQRKTVIPTKEESLNFDFNFNFNFIKLPSF